MDACSSDRDHCSCELYHIMQEDCSVASVGVLTNADLSELETITTGNCHLLSPPHDTYMSFPASSQICEDYFLDQTDSSSVVVQDVIEEEVNVRDSDNSVQYGVKTSDDEPDLDALEMVHMYIEYKQNITVPCCYVCCRQFLKLLTLKGHMKRHHGVLCDMSKVTEKVIPMAIVCRLCGFVSDTLRAETIYAHVLKKHHIPVGQPARHCKTNPHHLMRNRKRTADHEAAHLPIICLICKSEIALVKNYNQHVKHYHQNDPKFVEAVSDVRRIQFEQTASSDGIVVNCGTCGEPHDEKRLVTHIRWKHGSAVNVKQLVIDARESIRSCKQKAASKQEVISCLHCGRRLRRISLSNHMKFYCNAIESAGNTDTAIRTARRYVKCSLCGKQMPRPKLVRHRRIVHHIGVYKPIETFICEYCPREFTEAHQLRTHLNKHTGKPPQHLL